MAEGPYPDDRAVSVAVTHVMAIGITTVLISGLLLAGGNMLDQQSDRAGERELRAIGDRISTELALAAERGHRTDATVTVRTRHRSSSVGGGYTVELTDDSTCYTRSGYDGCLTLTSSARPLEVEVPVSVPNGIDVEGGTVTGGQVAVVYDPDANEVTIRRAQDV